VFGVGETFEKRFCNHGIAKAVDLIKFTKPLDSEETFANKVKEFNIQGAWVDDIYSCITYGHHF